MLTFTLECYGWVALALPVYAKVPWNPEKPLDKSAHTGRAGATQPPEMTRILPIDVRWPYPTARQARKPDW